ncbi:uncharacterized protein METZ01_LOCUS5695 [marine metagenome]|uniref:Uncharacterized protein n=1 Tax=marine metagenome TaxID=408172 RepID=A0A381NE33_9ZZZZ
MIYGLLYKPYPERIVQGLVVLQLPETGVFSGSLMLTYKIPESIS